MLALSTQMELYYLKASVCVCSFGAKCLNIYIEQTNNTYSTCAGYQRLQLLPVPLASVV